MFLRKLQRGGVRPDAIIESRQGNIEDLLCSQNLEARVNPRGER